jgi:hypothetical protein
MDKALQNLKRSKLHAVVNIESNFSSSLVLFLKKNSIVETNLLENSKTVIYFDHAKPTHHFIAKKFLKIYKKISEDLLSGCNVSKKILSVP